VSYPLAVCAPYVGALSETFIRRHMCDLLPRKTAVIADIATPPYGGHWRANGPLLELTRIPAPNLGKRILDGLPWKSLPGSTHIEASIEDFLRKHNVRVVLGEYLDLSLKYLPIAKKLGVRFVGHAHGFDVSQSLRDPKWRAQYLRYNEVDAVVTMSEFSRRILIELGLRPDKVHVVPYGVEVPVHHVVREKRAAIRCLAVGRMVAKKAPILMLDAFRRATKAVPQLVLDYVGTGELLPAVQQFVKAFDLGSRVTLHGGQPNKEVIRLTDQADIFLQHSITDVESGDQEGLPVAILEAMAHALPVVSTRHAGIPEAVIDGLTGFLVDEGDSHSMAERIVTMAESVDLRQRMGYEAWKCANELFSWEKERGRLCEVLGLAHG
jgi:colanic acid/amylovoran biosynthesis glycosyltransferase